MKINSFVEAEQVMKLIMVAAFLTIVTAPLACTHLYPVLDGGSARGNRDEVLVGVGSSVVRVGDRVAVLKSICKKATCGRAGACNQCAFQPIGGAVIVKVLDSDHAFVRPDEGLQIDSSMRVERVSSSSE